LLIRVSRASSLVISAPSIGHALAGCSCNRRTTTMWQRIDTRRSVGRARSTSQARKAALTACAGARTGVCRGRQMPFERLVPTAFLGRNCSDAGRNTACLGRRRGAECCGASGNSGRNGASEYRLDLPASVLKD
jgi:hypothetical protein